MTKPALWLLASVAMLGAEIAVLNSHVPGRIPWGIACAAAAFAAWGAAMFTLRQYIVRIGPIHPRDISEEFDDPDASR